MDKGPIQCLWFHFNMHDVITVTAPQVDITDLNEQARDDEIGWV